MVLQKVLVSTALATMTLDKRGSRGFISSAALPFACVGATVPGQNLVKLQEKLQRPDDPEAAEGWRTIDQVLQCLECSEGASAKGVSCILEVVQDLLECCVEVVVVNKLGGFSRPVSTALQERWTFPSDHPPIGASISTCCGLKVDINLASWNVLNQNYMKYIKKNTQGLERSRIAEISEAERQEAIYMKVARMLIHPEKPKHVVCLQECWPQLLEFFRRMLPEQFELLTTGEQGKKNVEAMQGRCAKQPSGPESLSK